MGAIAASVTQAVDPAPQADVILQRDSLFVSARVPHPAPFSDSVLHAIAGVRMPVAALQVQIKLSSPHHKASIVLAQPAMRAGSRRAWKSPVNNGAYRGLFTVAASFFFFSFAPVVRQRSSLPVSWQLSQQAPSPRRRSSAPTTDAAQSILVLLFDPLH